jgi:hypothetical protein
MAISAKSKSILGIAHGSKIAGIQLLIIFGTIEQV